MEYVIKRNGTKAKFDKSKIVNAIEKAMIESDALSDRMLSESIANEIAGIDDAMDVEAIQNIVENRLMQSGRYEVARSYMNYRYLHGLARNEYKELMNAVEEKLLGKKIDNQNANVDEASFGGRIGEMSRVVSKRYALEYCMSEMSRKNHENNEIYIHDLDSYAVGMHNCLSLPIDDLLANGFNTRQVDIRPAQSINTAFQLIAVAFQIQSLQQFGGVSATHLDWTMVPYVRKSFRKHYLDGLKFIEGMTDYDPNHIPEDAGIENVEYKDFPKTYNYALEMTKRELNQAVEGLYHNLNSLQSRSGNQLPFSSVNYGTCTLPEGRMVIEALLNASIKGVGKLHRTSIFPCGIFQMMKGVNRKPGDSNYDLYQLALRSTAQRLYPNYVNVDWSKNAGYDRNDPRTYTSTMGCRTYNGYDINGFGQLKDGRGNICPVTIIMPTLAMEAKEAVGENASEKVLIDEFMKILDKKIHEAKDMLIERFEWICSQKPESAKFMWENNVMYGYIPEEGIRSALKHGTLGIGQIGLAETLQILVGCNQIDPHGMETAKRIESLFARRCDEFKHEYSLNFGVYLTPEHNKYCLWGLAQ